MIILDRSKRYRRKVFKGLYVAFFVVLFIVVSFGVRQSLFSKQNQQIVSAGLEPGIADTIVENIPKNLYPLLNWDIENLKIQAPAAISIEIDNVINKVLFSKNETARMPIASLAKLMTALVVLENYNLDQKVTVSPVAMAQEGEHGNLKSGETLSAKDLLYITLIESSNDSAYALSEVMGTKNFVNVMNKTAQKLELSNTHFFDSSGLSANSYSSAEDIAKLTNYLFKTYPIFNQIINTKEYDLYLKNGQLHHKLINTNKLLGQRLEIIGGKTGWTTDAKGCFMVIEKSPIEGNYIIHVILGSPDRVLEMENIIDWVLTAYRWSI